MSKWSNQRELSLALTVMQILCIAALLLGTVFAFSLSFLPSLAIIHILFDEANPNSLAISLAALTALGVLTVLVVSACSYAAIISFFRMCGRLKHRRAFTQENSLSLRLISRAAFIAGIALIVTPCVIILIFVLQAGPESIGLTLRLLGFVLALAFLYLGVGFVCRALRSLLERVRTMQDENELTV